MEYTEKSKHLSEHLWELKTEIEVLKKEDTESKLDKLHEESVQRGENKYSTLRTVSNTYIYRSVPIFRVFEKLEWRIIVRAQNRVKTVR